MRRLHSLPADHEVLRFAFALGRGPMRLVEEPNVLEVEHRRVAEAWGMEQKKSHPGERRTWNAGRGTSH